MRRNDLRNELFLTIADCRNFANKRAGERASTPIKHKADISLAIWFVINDLEVILNGLFVTLDITHENTPSFLDVQ